MLHQDQPDRALIILVAAVLIVILVMCGGFTAAEGAPRRPTATPCATQETVVEGVTRGCGALVRHQTTPIAPRRVTPTAGRTR